MKLALKKLHIFEEASDKSVCFVADFWVDDMCISEVKNTGDGKPHEWKPVKYYQKFKAEDIAARLANARHMTDLDAWVNSVVRAARQKSDLAKTLKEDEQVIIDDITGEPVVAKKQKEIKWKPKQSKMKAKKEKPDYSSIPFKKLEHKGQTYQVQLIGETLSHNRLYDKYQTKEGKILHQIRRDGQAKAITVKKAVRKGKVDVSDL
jgi:hypothetical protein